MSIIYHVLDQRVELEFYLPRAQNFILTEGKQLTAPEYVQKGNIRFHTYQSYISAAGGYCIVLLVFLSFLLNVGSTAFSSWWLALWIKAGGGVSSTVCHFYWQHSMV